VRDFTLFITSGATNVQIPAVVEARSDLQRFQQVTPPQSIGPDRELFRISLGIVLSLTAAQFRTTSDSIQIRRRMTTILTLLGNLAEPWKVTLEAVSQEVNLSTDYVRHIFKKATGVTFHYYLRYVRTNRAAHLLRSTFLSIEEIAASLSYDYTTNFPRDFRALLGIYPATYRMIREVPDPLIEKFSIDVPRSDRE
jgi:AraC-like DNA-binding protein